MREEGERLEGYDGGGAEELAAGILRDHLFGGGGVGVEDAVDWGGLVRIGEKRIDVYVYASLYV